LTNKCGYGRVTQRRIFEHLQINRVSPPSGFKSASATQNLMNQVAGGFVNRLQPVWCISRGIDPAPKLHLWHTTPISILNCQKERLVCLACLSCRYPGLSLAQDHRQAIADFEQDVTITCGNRQNSTD
jgi:hypothetical protein